MTTIAVQLVASAGLLVIFARSGNLFDLWLSGIIFGVSLVTTILHIAKA
jgi:hypothetical protein